MNIDNFCNLGAALQNKQIEVGKQPQVYFYRSNEDSIYEMLSEGYFNALNLRVAKDDLILLYSPKDEQKVFAKVVSNSGGIVQIMEMSEDDFQHYEMPTPSAEYLNKIVQYIGNTTSEYTNGFFYKCVESSGNYLWENIIVQDSYLKSETYNKTETDTELAKKLNTDGSNIFTGVLKMRASISFKGAVAPSWSGIGFFKLNDDNSVSLMASMEETDGFTPASNNTYNIGVNSRKWKDLYLAGKAHVPTINNGGDIAIPTVAGTMARVEDIENKISNCITEIPQDIKLELNNGTLTLKAGSKAYMPNGSGVFTEVTSSADITYTPSWGAGYQCYVAGYVDNDGKLSGMGMCRSDLHFSGATAPTTTINGTIWYDTTINKIKTYQNNSWIYDDPSCSRTLFLGIITVGTGNVITSIDQIFNGFGYIGHHTYKLPNVKGLVAYGRNEDETLKSFTVGSSDIQLYELPNNRADTYMYISRANTFIMGVKVSDGYPKYDANKNWCYCNSSSTDSYLPVVKFATNSSNQVTLFEIKTPFHAVDYNDTEFIASQSASSDRYIDLTLAVSGTSYTAQATGWIMFSKVSTSAEQYVELGISNSIRYRGTAISNASTCVTSLYVEKGQKFYATYTADGNTNYFRFIYAKGSK